MAAAALLALDPAGLGGVRLRAQPGPVRDRWLTLLRALADGPVRKLPASVRTEALLGGLDLAATLAAGAPRHTRGALAEVRGGVLLLAMAERLTVSAAAHIAQAQDAGGGFGFVLLDEGIGDEAPPAALLERAALCVELDGMPLRPAVAPELGPAREMLAAVEGEDAAAALCGASVALGVMSGRAPLLAWRAARAAAALGGRDAVGPEDAQLAARLVLAPRATQVPVEEEAGEQQGEPDVPPAEDEGEAKAEGDAASETRDAQAGPLGDQVLEAARAAIPAGLLAALQSGGQRMRQAGKSGALMRGTEGRRVGALAGLPRDGKRLDLLATIRAAAPWQRLRGGAPPLRLRRDDLRVERRERKSGTTTIFVVDASGSQALNRLAEAKGAVELLLADCYVRRDEVAVVAFRGRGAEVLLPPTRSLVRAKRSLAGLPGGGGTPLAAGIDAGGAMAATVRRRGGVPALVLLTDGAANVGRDGFGGRARAQEDAAAAARVLRAAAVPSVLVDTAPRPNQAARTLAAAMDARYVPLPYADAAALNRTVRSLR